MRIQNKLIIIVIILCSFFLTTGFTNVSKQPQTYYRVYLKGKSLGVIASKEDFENYIDKKQEEIKKKYKVDKVYVPEDLNIVKEITFERDVKTNKEIYDVIKDTSPFTINGYVIKIKGLSSKDEKGTTTTPTQTIYVLDKDIFIQSVDKTVKSFIDEEDYNNFANDTQTKIEDTGKIIENIYIKNKITIKQSKIPVDKTIYQTEEELSKYLLFGTTSPQATYVIKDGDTINDVAFNNKLSVEEFLIANPDLQDAKSLLSPGQIVTLGIIKPQFSLVEEDTVVTRQVQNYTTETRYDDSKMTDYVSIIQAGEKGENRVTQYVQKVNGETVNLVTTKTEKLKEPVTEVVVRGTRRYYWSGYGDIIVVPGEWGWPASCATISSPFGWRWGVLHDGTDIAGCGYGSNIFAAQAGEVIISGSKVDNGQYIVIDHKNGYTSMYAHLCVGCRYVSAGQYVEKGQIIAGMGQTGNATGVHLHFSIWQGGAPYTSGARAVDPMIFY